MVAGILFVCTLLNAEFIVHRCYYQLSYVCVTVACGVRLSRSVFMVYSVLLSVSLVARALSIALRLQCVYVWREAWL